LILAQIQYLTNQTSKQQQEWYQQMQSQQKSNNQPIQRLKEERNN
jgi:hypothetical protein